MKWQTSATTQTFIISFIAIVDVYVDVEYAKRAIPIKLNIFLSLFLFR